MIEIKTIITMKDEEINSNEFLELIKSNHKKYGVCKYVLERCRIDMTQGLNDFTLSASLIAGTSVDIIDTTDCTWTFI